MLIPKQLNAAGMLARGISAVQTARDCGVSRSTLYRWKAGPAFHAAFMARCQELEAALAREFQALAFSDRQRFISSVRAVNEGVRAAVPSRETQPAPAACADNTGIAQCAR